MANTSPATSATRRRMASGSGQQRHPHPATLRRPGTTPAPPPTAPAPPGLLRHALASVMAADKEPASIIAAQLRHADGGALAQRVYIHQLPQTAPRLAGVIEGVFGSQRVLGRRCRQGV